MGRSVARQDLSADLRRVGAGETFAVTARGRPVALLAPTGTSATPLERLIASGRASRPERGSARAGSSAGFRAFAILSRALGEQRAERL